MKSRLTTIALASLMMTSAHAGISVGVFGGSDSAEQAVVVNNLINQGAFDSVVGLNGSETAQDLAIYNVVLLYSNYAQGFAGFGDQLADYLDAGGRMVAATFLPQTLSPEFSQSYGRLQSGGYLPWTSYQSNYSTSTLGSYDASTGIFDGVNTLTGYYRDIVTTGPDTNVLGYWADGAPLVAVNQKGVVGVFLFPNDSYGLVSGDYNRLFANTLTYAAAVPEPNAIALLLAGLGAVGIAARRRAA